MMTLHDLIDRLLQRLPAGDSDRTPLKRYRVLYKHPKSDQSDQADPQSAVANFTASDGWDRNSSNGQNGRKGKGKGKGKGYPNGKWQNSSKAKPGERPRDGFSEPARNDQAGVRGQYSPCNSPGRSAEGERQYAGAQPTLPRSIAVHPEKEKVVSRAAPVHGATHRAQAAARSQSAVDPTDGHPRPLQRTGTPIHRTLIDSTPTIRPNIEQDRAVDQTEALQMIPSEM